MLWSQAGLSEVSDENDDPLLDRAAFTITELEDNGNGYSIQEED